MKGTELIHLLIIETAFAFFLNISFLCGQLLLITICCFVFRATDSL